MDNVLIWDSARKHGVSDYDMMHALRYATAAVRVDDDVTMVLGPRSDGTMLEVGVKGWYSEGQVVVLHAMRMRAKFEAYLPRGVHS